jgi:hypothetical protein
MLQDANDSRDRLCIPNRDDKTFFQPGTVSPQRVSPHYVSLGANFALAVLTVLPHASLTSM